MKVLYIGESWLGSCARSLKEALGRRADLEVDEVNEDAWFTRPRALWLRAVNRLTANAYRREFNRHVLEQVRLLRPDFVIAYKGNPVRRDLIAELRDLGARVVNIYPDCSPHAHGAPHREAVGAYDLVVSTKPFHPANWETIYGYRNRCCFVPQGYDPLLHLVDAPPADFRYDVVMVATYRPEYAKLMIDAGKAIGDRNIRVAIGGYGWDAVRHLLPRHWEFRGPVHGRGYVSLLREGKICIAPLTREVMVDGRPQPGDVDTTRTYELAAAHCFFIHRRTDYARALYGEDEVPMYDNASELGELVRRYLALDDERAQMAARAHRRAVPAYSLDARAEAIVELLRRELDGR